MNKQTETELSQIYTLVKDQAGNHVLTQEGKEMVCPYQPPLALANQFGGNSILRMPCSTQCALAEVEIGNESIYSTYCTGSRLVYECAELPETKILT